MHAGLVAFIAEAATKKGTVGGGVKAGAARKEGGGGSEGEELFFHGLWGLC